MDHRGKYLQLIICFFISKVNFRKVPVPHTLGSPVLKNPFLTVLQPDKAFCEHGDPVFFSLKDILSVCFWIYLNLPIFVHCLSSCFLIQVRTPGIKSSPQLIIPGNIPINISPLQLLRPHLPQNVSGRSHIQ